MLAFRQVETLYQTYGMQTMLLAGRAVYLKFSKWFLHVERPYWVLNIGRYENKLFIEIKFGKLYTIKKIWKFCTIYKFWKFYALEA